MPATCLVEVLRGDFAESFHDGHAVICDAAGRVTDAWGNPETVILPRSACKMIQALPLVESGAADAAGLTAAQLALACASHKGAAIHSDAVRTWLADLHLSDAALRCGPEEPRDIPARDALIRAGAPVEQLHNNCSGKHTGFLTLARHLNAGPEYIDPAHPVQLAVREAFEDMTGAPSPGFAIDGCSAPNFASSLHGLARAMARFAVANPDTGSARDRAAARLRQAMIAHPEMVAGEGRACTRLMRAAGGRAALKTGAEGVFTAILPDLGLGIAVKIADGATRAAECTISALLAGLGVLDPAHPDARAFLHGPIRNRRGIEVGAYRPAPSLFEASANSARA